MLHSSIVSRIPKLHFFAHCFTIYWGKELAFFIVVETPDGFGFFSMIVVKLVSIVQPNGKNITFELFYLIKAPFGWFMQKLRNQINIHTSFPL